jgi:hypothetical protein
MDKTYIYNNAQMLCLLDDFQYESNRGKYKKSIPYDTWRQIKKCQKVNIRVVGSFCMIFNHSDDANGSKKLYTDKIYEFGFGRFFYDTVIKKEQEKNMEYEYKSNADTTYSDNTLTFKIGTSQTNANKTNFSPDAITYADGITFNHNTGELSYTIDTKTNWWNGLADSASISATATYTTKDELNTIKKTFEEYLKTNNTTENKKENEKMKGFNFDFGPCDNSKVHMSMYGIAIKNKAGEWVSYNATSGEIINVDIFNIDNMTKFIYKMPVASNAVEVGDVIIHNGYPMFVQAIGEEFKSFDVVDVYAGESKTVIPTKNMFGFDVMTKVVSLFDATAMVPTADQPFGNMLPFLMMGDGKVDPMAMMLMMNQNGSSNPFGNPMMMYFMMKDNKDIDPMMLMLMMNQTQPHTCQCGKH